ncbi:MAG: hypothetical protein AAF533_19290 [Acidobacteriota bacterium]
MRTGAIIINTLAVVFFAAFLAYTFVGHRHVERMARDFAAEKTQELAEFTVGLAEEALKSPLVRKLLPAAQVTASERELADYRDDPQGYIGELVGQAPPPLDEASESLLTKASRWKPAVREHFDAVLGQLIRDLRIFSFSNLLAAAFAAWLAHRAKNTRPNATALLSLFLFASMAYCTHYYVDNLSFFKLLFNSRLGWWYPVLLLVTGLGTCFEYWRFKRKLERHGVQLDADPRGASPVPDTRPN